MSPDDDYLLRRQVETVTARLREEGCLDEAGESALVRYYSERAHSLETGLRDIVDEYTQRVSSEGEDAAQRWLTDAARTLGQRDGEDTRRMIATTLDGA